jgi:hypothetical protein
MDNCIITGVFSVFILVLTIIVAVQINTGVKCSNGQIQEGMTSSGNCCELRGQIDSQCQYGGFSAPICSQLKAQLVDCCNKQSDDIPGCFGSNGC